jgi:hypothetical protein
MSITRRIFLSSPALALSAGKLALGAQAGSQIDVRRKQAMPNSIATLLKRNLTDVFGENDPVRRRAAIGEIFTEDAVFYDPNKNVYRGRAEIDRIAGVLRETHRDFTYQPLAEPEEVGNGGRIRWVEGRPGEPPATAGSPPFISFSTN